MDLEVNKKEDKPTSVKFHNDNHASDNEIIILDDDDFIQTTLNLLDKLPKPGEDPDHENNLIDLTSDFDLNDLFQINPGTNNGNKSDQQIVKNELDLKMFNFNFDECMEEILIEDDDEHEDATNINKPMESMVNDSSLVDTIPFSIGVVASNTVAQKLYKCRDCNKIFHKVYNLKRHIFMHKSRNTMNRVKTNSFQLNECQNCKRHILDKSNFAKHVKICQKKETKKSLNSKLNTCEDNDSLKHIEIDPKQYLISSFNTQPETKLKNNLQCKLCHKSFNKKFNFHRHLRVHFLNVSMYPQHSSATDNDPYSYYDINRIDNDKEIKLFQCSNCQRKFAEKKQLTAHWDKWHMTTYACSQCPLRLNDKFEHIRHMNSVHAMKFEFGCKHCLRSFRYMSHYLEHRRSHLKMDTFDDLKSKELKCNYCGKLFAKVFNLNRHISNKHKNS